MENNKEPIKVKLSTVILVFIIILLIMIMVGMYIYYNNLIKDDKGNNTEKAVVNTLNNVQENSIEQQTSTIVDLDVDDEQVTKLYSYIPDREITNRIDENAYQSKRITLSSLPEKYLLECAFVKLNLTSEQKEEYTEVDEWYLFNADILQDKVEELYGERLSNLSFDIGAGKSCRYIEENNKYLWSYGRRIR